MNTPELESGYISSGYHELLAECEDPLRVAMEGIQKLKEAGLPTVIAAGSDAVEREDNVYHLDEFRRTQEPGGGLADAAGETALSGPAGDRQDEETAAVFDAFDDPAPPSERIAPEPADDQYSRLSVAQQEMISEHMPRVEIIAKKLLKGWYRKPHEYEEVVSDGYLGLVRAARNFDLGKVPDNASSNVSYIAQSIKGAMLHGMRLRYGREYEPVKDESGRVIGQRSNIRRLKPSVMDGTATASSLDQPAGPEYEDDSPLGDFVACPNSEEEVINKVFLKHEIEQLLEDCSPGEREILYRRVVLDETQRAIGEAVGISQMQVSRILRRIANRRKSNSGLHSMQPSE